jgi:hypothetical protein
MSNGLSLFFGHSFATDRINDRGDPDASGISDAQLAHFVKTWIEEFSGGQIKVVTTRDPLRNYISSQVRSDIGSADAVLCLFTRRVKDHLTGHWISSTYVISEGAAAFAQFGSELEANARLYGLVEEGVDRTQLGMAFHANRSSPGFSRGRLDELRTAIGQIVDEILRRAHVRQEREYVALDKTVTVWRSGAVQMECVHRFRFTKPQHRLAIPHTLWRISRDLPPLKDMMNGARTRGNAFLGCCPIYCGQDRFAGTYRVRPTGSLSKNEQNFYVEFDRFLLPAGDQLSYEIGWGYPHAFQDPSTLPPGEPNSVGLRTADRGRVQFASLTIKFERFSSDEEPQMVPEELPQVFVNDANHLPAAMSPVTFWHHAESWKPEGEMKHCSQASGALFDAYRWSTDSFMGMAKVIWTPRYNYLQADVARESLDVSRGGSNLQPAGA